MLPQPGEQARRLGKIARNPTTVSANPTDVLSNIENWRTSIQKLNELTNWIPMKEDIKTAFESLIAPVVEHVSEFELSRELIKRKAYASITTTDADVYKYITSIQEEILKLPRSTQWKEADSQEYQEEAYDAYSQEQDDVEEADEEFNVDKWHEEMYGPYEDETHQEDWDGDDAYQNQEQEGYDDEAYDGYDDGTYEQEGYDDEAYDGYDDEAYDEEEGYDNEAWAQEEGYEDEAYEGYDDRTYEQEGYEAWEQEEGYDNEAWEQEEGYDDEAYDEQEGYDNEAYDQEGNWDGDEAYQDQEQEWCGDEAENHAEDTRQYGQCIFFASPEGCRRGDMCRYRHDCDPNTGVPLPAPNRRRRRYRRGRRGEPGPEESYSNLPTAGRPQTLHPGIGCCIVTQRPPGLSQWEHNHLIGLIVALYCCNLPQQLLVKS